jgi:lysophospholipase L1-like esterase
MSPEQWAPRGRFAFVGPGWVLACAIGCGSQAATPTSPAPDPGPADSQGCARTSVGLTPLVDMGASEYRGEPGGLYGSGANVAPPAHLDAGVALARGIQRRDADGQPSPTGRYAFVSIGMSNTTQEFRAFIPLATADPDRDPGLAIVDGAQGGMTAADWAAPGCACWSRLDDRLREAGVSAAQVAAVWVKLANRQPSSGWPAYARALADDTIGVVRLLKARFPNLRLAYLSSRIYAGYATTTLNPEPYAYESGFATRWAILDQITGAPSLAYAGANAPAPWLAWGPYLWADGLRARGDGLTWSCGDLQADGTHPSPAGREKVAQRLLGFLRTDPTAREWYLR